jgi:hypothetical protein
MKELNIIIFLSLLYINGSSLLAECTTSEVIQMHEKGLSEKLIESVCAGKGGADHTQEGQRCVTEFGICSLSAPAPIGMPCYCINKYSGHSDKGKVQK